MGQRNARHFSEMCLQYHEEEGHYKPMLSLPLHWHALLLSLQLFSCGSTQLIVFHLLLRSGSPTKEWCVEEVKEALKCGRKCKCLDSWADHMQIGLPSHY